MIAVASLVVEHGLEDAWAQWLWLLGSRAGSVVVAFRRSCSGAYADPPGSGIEPMSSVLHWQADSSTLSH